jgi:hypothetical protein
VTACCPATYAKAIPRPIAPPGPHSPRLSSVCPHYCRSSRVSGSPARRESRPAHCRRLSGGTTCCPVAHDCVIIGSWTTKHGEVTLVVRSAVSSTAVENLRIAGIVVSLLALASLESLVLLTGTPGRSGNARKNPFGRFLFLSLDRTAETDSRPVGERTRSPGGQPISGRVSRGSVLPC